MIRFNNTLPQNQSKKMKLLLQIKNNIVRHRYDEITNYKRKCTDIFVLIFVMHSVRLCEDFENCNKASETATVIESTRSFLRELPVCQPNLKQITFPLLMPLKCGCLE